MTPATLLASLRSDGFTVRLGEGAHAGRLIVNPGDKLTAEQVAAVREHKADLLAMLIEEAADSADGEAIIDAIAGRAVADDPFRRTLPGRQPAASADGAPALAGRAADGVQREGAGRSGVAEDKPLETVIGYPFTEEELDYAWHQWGCNCGPAALAFACRIGLETVRGAIPDFEAKRYTSPSMMRAALGNLGRTFTEWPSDTDYFRFNLTLVRLQWTGPWTAKGANPRWAYSHTHWICAWHDFAGGQLIFDVNGGVQTEQQWLKTTVPALARSIKRADGGWHPTHVWEVESRQRAEPVPPAVGYVAWMRQIGGDEYEPVRFHSDRDRCMALLREQMAVEGGHCEGMVLPAGENPNRRRRPR